MFGNRTRVATLEASQFSAIAVACSMSLALLWAPGCGGGGDCIGPNGLTCNAHGTCAKGACVCSQQYAGTDCGQCSEGYLKYPTCAPDPCAGNDCSGHGTCADGTCTCATGYAGDRCDQCAAGRSGYPSCCTGVTCAGHGQCANGACACNTGYAGDNCDQCATGYKGYPTCTACTCTVGVSKCADTSSVTLCADGCSLSTVQCTTYCSSSGHANSSGCASESPDNGHCLCADSGVAMEFAFTDSCQDGESPVVEFFDMTKGTQWSSFVPPTSGNRLFDIECTANDRICWGAWIDNPAASWGCGKYCGQDQTCSNCCYTCGPLLTIPQISLGCP